MTLEDLEVDELLLLSQLRQVASGVERGLFRELMVESAEHEAPRNWS